MCFYKWDQKPRMPSYLHVSVKLTQDNNTPQTVSKSCIISWVLVPVLRFQYVDDPPSSHSLSSHILLYDAFTLWVLALRDNREVTIDEFLSGFKGLRVDLYWHWVLLAWIQGFYFTSYRRGRDGELLGDVVQDTARLDNVGLFVQWAFLCKTKLHQTPETPLHGAKRCPHDVVDLRVGLVEADLAVICRFWHRSQNMFAQVVAFPTFKINPR